MPRQRLRLPPSGSLGKNIVVDIEQEFGPDLPLPDPQETGWARVVPLEHVLERKTQRHPTLLARAIAEMARVVREWAGTALYVQEQDESRQEIHEVVQFAQFLATNHILQRVWRRPNPTDVPQLIRFSAATTPVQPSATDGTLAGQVTTHGFSFSPTRALWKAVAECAERYSQAHYKKEGFIYTSFTKLGSPKAVDPFRATAFSEAERALDKKRQFSHDSLLYWASARNVATGEGMYAPAQLFHYNYAFSLDEPLLRQPISTGAAGGFSQEAALYGGLCEAIERDAFMISYMHRLPLPRIDLRSIHHPEIQKLVEAFERYKLRIEVVDMTTDIKVPAMLGMIVDEFSDRGPGVSVGAKVDTDPLWAIRGAIEEAWHALTGGRVEAERRRKFVFRTWKFDEVRRPTDHIGFWCRPSMRQHVQFYLRGPVKKYRGPNDFHPRNPRKQLDAVVSALQRAGMQDILYREVTLPVLKKVGFVAVATLVPELTHMFLNESMRATGSRRLQEVPQKLGYKPLLRLNPIPHPFP